MRSSWIIKSLLNKLNIDKSLYFIIILVITGGLFKEFIILFSIILIHEMGHIFTSILFKWELKKINIYPFGGCIEFNTLVNRNLFEEFLILISGPLVQIIYFLIILILYKNNLVLYKTFNIFKTYFNSLLLFNLMPIYPLDGGRLINILFNKYMPLKKGNKNVIYISILILFLFVINSINYNKVLMFILILVELIKYYKDQDIIYNKFLLERYLNNYNFNKYKTVNSSKDIYKENNNTIYYKNHYITEKDYLNKRYGG